MKVNVFSATVFGALALAASSVAMAQDTPATAPGAVPAAPVDSGGDAAPTATAAGGPAASASASKHAVGVARHANAARFAQDQRATHRGLVR